MSRPSTDRVGLAVLAVIGAGALVASSSYLAELARLTGWTAWSSWILPLTVDVLAAYGVREWVRPASTDVQRRTGRTVALSMLAVSIAGNATDHVLRAGDGAVAWTVLVVLVGTVPPVALFVAVHLHTLGTVPVPSRRPSRKTSEKAGDVIPEPVTPVQPALDPPVQVPTGPSPVLEPLHAVPVDDCHLPQSPAKGEDGPVGDVEKVRALDEEHQTVHGRPISRDKVRAALGCGNGRASELLKSARAA